MNNAPILILQMQRMGDLVLSFPLLGWLARLYPAHPLWVLGEQAFFEPLMPLSPQVTYFSYDASPNLSAHPFHMVINLSHRPEAASLAGRARTDTLIGPYLNHDARLHIQGDWQLYRASLTHNNRYNRFHWADLNALDVIPENLILRTNWPLPRPFPLPDAASHTPFRAVSPSYTGVNEQTATQNEAHTQSAAPEEKMRTAALSPVSPHAATGARIGLFLGASEVEKHPDAEFWAALARRLLQAGHKPVLLGGKAEEPLGLAVARLLDAHPLNLCGHFTVSALAHFIAELDLLITPDTGPMHIAVWTGAPTLNLSLGPVNPWETGPFSPGHHIVRANRDCVGCWQCTEKTVACKEQMVAVRVAAIVEHLLCGEALEEREGEIPSPKRSGGMEMLARKTRGLELLRSQRGAYGLYSLEQLFPPLHDPAPPGGNVAGKESPALRDSLATFWQAWFGAHLNRFEERHVAAAWATLAHTRPDVATAFHQALAELTLTFAKTLKHDPADIMNDAAFWRHAPPLLRPFSGYAHMYIQNAGASRASLLHILHLVEQLQSLG